MIVFTMKHPMARPEMLGYIPSFFYESDPRSAAEQLNDRYQHGGGWLPFKGFTMKPDGLHSPGDHMMRLIAEATLRNEIIRFYEGEWLAIVQPDDSYEVSRCN